MRRLLVLMMLGSLLAGCTSSGSGGPDLMTARQAQQPAQRSADGWADDAVLTGLAGQELDDGAREEFAAQIADNQRELQAAHEQGEVPDEMYEAFADLMGVAEMATKVHDGAVGDGRAALWTFEYLSASNQDGYLVAVMHGEVVFRRSLSQMFGEEVDADDFADAGMDAIGDWSVDSDVASAAASLGDAEYSRLCAATNVMSSIQLSQGDEGAVWTVGVEQLGGAEGDEGGSAYVAVDANTGSLVQDEVDEVIDVLMQEAGEAAGAFTANVEAHQEHEFDVLKDGHAQIAFEIGAFPAPVQPIAVTLTDPLGARTELSLAMGQTPFTARQSVVLPVAPMGTYRVELDVPVGAYTQWRFTWCTDGTPLDDEDEYFACQLLDQSGGGDGGAGRPSPAETLSPLARWLGAWQP